MANTNIIELNGKRYDALSGQFLGKSETSVMKGRMSKHHSGKAIDGVLRSPKAATTIKSEPPKPTSTPTTHSVPKKQVMDVTRPTPHRANARQPQRSQTLMRHVVHKPQPSLKRHVTAQTRTDILARQPGVVIAPKISYGSISQQRQAHAKHVTQSKLISKFAPAATISARPSAVHTTVAPVQRPTHPTHSPVHHRPPMDIFEQAIASAKSHEQVPIKPARNTHKSKHRIRTLSTVVASLAVVALAGFFAYQNKANVEVKLASMRAGFHIVLPGYKPTGFSFSTVHARPGIADVSFRATPGGNDFTITQKQSNWNSETLLSNFVSLSTDSYKTYESAGRTIYVYGSGKATWVDNGVWYQLTGDNLSNDQLVKLATST